MKRLFEEGIDAYVADILFRKRDPRFAEASRYKERQREARREERMKSGGVLFTNHDFHYDPEQQLLSVLRARSSIVMGATWSSTAIGR